MVGFENNVPVPMCDMHRKIHVAMSLTPTTVDDIVGCRRFSVTLNESDALRLFSGHEVFQFHKNTNACVVHVDSSKESIRALCLTIDKADIPALYSGILYDIDDEVNRTVSIPYAGSRGSASEDSHSHSSRFVFESVPSPVAYGAGAAIARKFDSGYGSSASASSPLYDTMIGVSNRGGLGYVDPDEVVKGKSVAFGPTKGFPVSSVFVSKIVDILDDDELRALSRVVMRSRLMRSKQSPRQYFYGDEFGIAHEVHPLHASVDSVSSEYHNTVAFGLGLGVVAMPPVVRNISRKHIPQGELNARSTSRATMVDGKICIEVVTHCRKYVLVQGTHFHASTSSALMVYTSVYLQLPGARSRTPYLCVSPRKTIMNRSLLLSQLSRFYYGHGCSA